MKILGISGSYRKGKTIDTLMDAALAACNEVAKDVQIEKIRLIDQHIEYCRNCTACKEDDPKKPIARCVIEDDMAGICEKIVAADAFVLGVPINYGTATAVTKTFLERATWVLAKPGTWPIKGCPTPRSAKKRWAGIIISAGTIPPWLRWFCDDATKLLRDFCQCNLNARIADDFYAGAVEKRGTEYYLARARLLGRRLAQRAAQTI